MTDLFILFRCYDLETYERKLVPSYLSDTHIMFVCYCSCSCLDTTYKQPGGFSRSLVARYL